MYPAFDIAGNLVCTVIRIVSQHLWPAPPALTTRARVLPVLQLGFVLGQCYYPKGCYEGLDTPASLSRLRVMLEQVHRALNR